ncbi:MAG: S1C family serine protease [Thermodesulfobacteriota bacterium]|nr:S1C family serine protease [Thermodesulfobacteriota bacterium]
MKKVVFTILTVISIAISLPAYADQEAKEILKAVVKIRSIIPKEAHSAGTLGTEREGNGVVIDSKGHILTIGYLIIEAESIEVTPPEGKPVSATFVGFDHATGFGLLKTEIPLNVKPMKMGQSAKVKEGEPVVIAGYGGEEEAVQAARVISRKEFTGYWEYILEDALYTVPAFVNYGGAALIDRNGLLVGIGSLFSQVVIPGFGTIPCNISVPIDLLPPILNDLITKGRPQKAPRPWLGINAEEAQGRVFVTRVTPGGPAEKGGLKPGDLVPAVKGREVNGLTDFYRKVWALGNAGVEVPLAILQGIQIREITIRSSDRYQFLTLKPQKIL